MNTIAVPLRLSLDDLLADLWHARRKDDLGRLAFVAYCEVRRWARQAGDMDLADRAAAMVIDSPHASREDFLAQADALISELERLSRETAAEGATGGRSVPPGIAIAGGARRAG